jgi:hypothetical protein
MNVVLTQHVARNERRRQFHPAKPKSYYYAAATRYGKRPRRAVPEWLELQWFKIRTTNNIDRF